MRRIISTILAILPLFSLFAQDVGILNAIEKGKFNVGFTHQTLFDYSRTYSPDHKYRPIQLTIWYPSSNDLEDQAMLYKEYVCLFNSDSNQAIEDFKKDPLQYGAKDSILNDILSSKTLASKEAKIKKGSFPLILFTPGIYEKAYSNAILCEQLASNGYIVASTSYLEAYSTKMESKPKILLEPQIRDMEFILAHMRNFENVDFEKVGIIGHSAGGSSALTMAIRNSNIDVIAILDGSFIGNPGLTALDGFNYFDPKYLDVPFLHFISGYWRKKGEVHNDFNNQFFDGLEKSKTYQLDMFDLLHQSFVSDMHLRFDNSGIDYKQFGIEQDEEKTDNSYFLISDITLSFFNIYLKDYAANFSDELQNFKNENMDYFDYEVKSTQNKN